MFDHLVGLPFDRDNCNGGVNCWELVRRAFAQAGVACPDYMAPATFCVQAITTRMIQARNDWTRLDAVRPVCLVAFMGTSPDAPTDVTHVGFVLDRRRFLHIREGHRSSIERLAHPFWSQKIAGYYLPRSAA